jgi:TetR/AcrR family transcriptional regulator
VSPPRSPDQTRAAIIDAAAVEFSLKGFDGTTLTAVAQRAKISKQLLHHHFGNKDNLFLEVHAARFRPASTWDELLPDNAADLFASRFEKRVKDHEYVRFLAWEAASASNCTVPGQKARAKRLGAYGDALKKMQQDGGLPSDMDHRLLQLAILCLATYPIAFSQITKLVTGHHGTDEAFQREWADFLRKIGRRLFAPAKMEAPGVARTADTDSSLKEAFGQPPSTKRSTNTKKKSPPVRAAS